MKNKSTDCKDKVGITRFIFPLCVRSVSRIVKKDGNLPKKACYPLKEDDMLFKKYQQVLKIKKVDRKKNTFLITNKIQLQS